MIRLAPVLMLLAGCDLFFTDRDDDDICALVDYAYPQLLDPYTGACVTDFTPQCRPCEPCPAKPDEPPLDWATCPGPCDGLGEAACLDTPSCRGAYSAGGFAACWSIAPSGPEAGTCEGLEAQACSRHDDCVAFYTDLGGETSQFLDCRSPPRR